LSNENRLIREANGGLGKGFRVEDPWVGGRGPVSSCCRERRKEGRGMILEVVPLCGGIIISWESLILQIPVGAQKGKLLASCQGLSFLGGGL
jgi:hypothetical protein